MVCVFPRGPRRPADRAFLARRLAAIDWRSYSASLTAGPPAEGSRVWLVESCRAELEWAHADWRRLTGGAGDDDRRFGPHPSEIWRLPHEAAAARLLNCQQYLVGDNSRIGALRGHLRSQRPAALDRSQSAAYRLKWADAAAGALGDLRMYRARRVLAWRAFLAAAADYRQQRAAIDNGPLRPNPAMLDGRQPLNSVAEIGHSLERSAA
jgi:hypothetical protein